jgi:hypothetical protein
VVTDRFVRRRRPLEVPDVLVERLRDDPVTIRRQQLYERQAEATAAVRKLAQDVEHAKAQDREAAGRSLHEDPSRKLPAPVAAKAQQRQAEAERELRAVDDALAMANNDLLRLGQSVADDVHHELLGRLKAAEAEAEEHLQAAAEAGRLAGRLRSEANWVATLGRAEDPRQVRTYFDRGHPSPVGQAAQTAVRQVAELKRQEAEAEERARRAEERRAEQADTEQVGTGRPVRRRVRDAPAA